ncbi:MAG: TetR/AcrR family transcriptional regulator [Methylotenera sp.]|uniref:TetR/AcrR family transcriptional regulator n=1 Tax=Methylotenera sp. TaxID=2051956 RepID=UPI00179C46C1|nr:TetR/AcrR family transcriptional regulator [Methylotenera sp.]NOU25314.1 TetR/AcrR family transcriptional regulator [Methylotenera sp.]
MNESDKTKDLVKPLTKPRGRPLGFKQDEALDKALEVFWSHGYEGTSMAELTDALGINKPSIYAAFGNKEALFRKALARYTGGPVAFVGEAMKAPTARQTVERLLTGAAEFFSDKSTPNGCMIVQGALTCGQSSQTIQQELIAYRKGFEVNLSKRFELAKQQGDLPQHVNSQQLAKYIATIHQGMSIQATSGATREELLAIVEIALKNWPES